MSVWARYAICTRVGLLFIDNRVHQWKKPKERAYRLYAKCGIPRPARCAPAGVVRPRGPRRRAARPRPGPRRGPPPRAHTKTRDFAYAFSLLYSVLLRETRQKPITD